MTHTKKALREIKVTICNHQANHPLYVVSSKVSTSIKLFLLMFFLSSFSLAEISKIVSRNCC